MADFADGIAKKIEDLWDSFGQVKYGRKDPASRAFTFGSQFTLGTMAINAAQFLGAPLALINEDWHNDWIKFNKQQWGLLITTMTHWWSPTLVRVSGDKSVRGQISQSPAGNLVCNFSERMMLIANHQIYTDWLYLWYIGYANGLHGQIHVVMKESLKKLPFVGWGMSLSKFIFLKRNWEQDKAGLSEHLQTLNKPGDPMWLMFFPEGTNLAPSTREKSKAWADKNGIKDMQHVLLPRSTGLQFCLLNLRETVDYVYDCTIAYEGVPRGEYAQDIFTLGSSWLSGKPPKSVNMYWRRFKISSIPLDDLKTFDVWLRARWAEKDLLMEHYMLTGRFPADTGFDNLGEGGQLREGAGHIETQVKPNNWYEILQVFAPIATIAIVLYYFYNKTLPTQLFDKAGDWAGMSEEEIKKFLKIGSAPKLGKPKTVSSQALKNTLQPPNPQQVKVAAVRPSSTRTQSQSTSIRIPTTSVKAPSTYAGSIAGTSKRATSSIAPSVSNPPSKVALPQLSPSKPTLPQKAAQKPVVQAMKPQKDSVKEPPKQKAPSAQAPAAKAVPKPTATPKPLVKPVKKAPPKEGPAVTTKTQSATPTAVKQPAPAKKPPPTQPNVKITAPATAKKDTVQKQAPATKPKTKTSTPAIAKTNGPTPKPLAKTKAASSAKEQTKPLPKTSAKTANTPKNPATIVKMNTSATKPTSTSTAKTPIKPQNTPKASTAPKTEPRRSSVQTNQGAWSETTAVDDPFSERPSGKRIVKAQSTRKDRVKVAKKLQRQHLDHVAS